MTSWTGTSHKDLEVSVGNIYTEYQLIHTFLYYFHQCGKYSAQISSNQESLRREENISDQKSLSVSNLQINYLNLDN